MAVTVEVDATRALAKFDRIPTAVRNSLRRIIPDLTKQLGALVNANLDKGLKTRTRLKVEEQMRENANRIVGVVTTVWTGDSAGKLVPTYLEEGTVAHEIEAKNALALAFFWDKLGKDVMFKRVWHPGFQGIHYASNALQAMQGEIVAKITGAVKTDAGRA